MKNLILHPRHLNSPFDLLENFWPQGLTNQFDASIKSPMVNIKENDHGYHIELAAPGFAKENFSLKVENDLLHVSAKKEDEKQTQNEKFTRKEFSFQSFERSFTLPEDVDAENVKANYENGVLKIELVSTKKAKSITRTISVN